MGFDWGLAVGGTYLDLINNRRPDLPNLLDFLDMSDAVIADANIPHLPRLLRLLQRKPHQPSALLPTIRAMYQKQIHISVFSIQLLHALCDHLVRRIDIAAGEQDLGRDEELVARNLGFADSAPDGGLVGVVDCGVDVAVAGLKGFEAGFDARRSR